MKKFLFAALLLVGQTAHAGIYERLTSTDIDKITTHSFVAALAEWSRNAVTRAQVISAFTLDSEETTEVDAIKGTYDGLGTAQLKAAYLLKISDVFILVEHGFYTESKAKTELGF